MRQLEQHLRPGRSVRTSLVVRGSPTTTEKLATSARRLAAQYTWRGSPAHGISVHVVDRWTDLDHLLSRSPCVTRRAYHTAQAVDLCRNDFDLLPTFSDPSHHTVLVEPYARPRIEELVELFGHALPNPHHRSGGRR